jgi:hypothetical protein
MLLGDDEGATEQLRDLRRCSVQIFRIRSGDSPLACATRSAGMTHATIYLAFLAFGISA